MSSKSDPTYFYFINEFFVYLREVDNVHCYLLMQIWKCKPINLRILGSHMTRSLYVRTYTH